MTETVATRARAPTMIGVIARKELTEIVRDGRFKWAAAMMAILLLTALLTGWQRFSAFREMQEHAQRTSNEQFAGQGEKHPHAGAHFGTWALKKAGGLSFFDAGVSGYTGNLIWIVAHVQNSAVARPADDLSAVTRFGDLDGATILQVLMPLLIIFLGFTSLAGERERGTLRQLVSMGVCRRDILWGKALGIAIAVVVVVGASVALGAIALAVIGVPNTIDAFGGRLAIMAVSYAVYALTVLFLTLAVSARAPTARSALIVLIGFWIFSAFLMPKVAVEISKAVHSSPSVGEFMADLFADLDLGPNDMIRERRFEEWQSSVLAQYRVGSIAELPVSWLGLLLQKLEDMDAEVFDRHYGDLRAAYTAQHRLQGVLGTVDPVLPLTSISAGLAGTDLQHHDRFTVAAEKYRRSMIKRVNDYLIEQAAADNRMDVTRAGFVAPAGFFESMPPFSYAPPTLAEVLAQQCWNLLLLGAWLLLSTAAAAHCIDRMEPGVR